MSGIKIASTRTILEKVKPMLISETCRNMELAKKGKLNGTFKEKELSFMCMIAPYVTRRKKEEIICYLNNI